jgi:hypothetical protein
MFAVFRSATTSFIDLTTGEPPPNLERHLLVVWTILGGIAESTPSRTGLSVGIHRSTISKTMAPIDGVRVGDHPLAKRLMSAVFNERPSRRANPALWDPLKVLSIFQHWPVSLPLSSLMRKGEFLMAIATTKRPSELVVLLCDDNHFRWEGENLRFVPSCLTKV